MGITYVEGRVKGPSEKEELVRFVVDSGATYSLLPKKVWTALGLEATRRESFALADGTTVKRAVSEAYLVLPKGQAHTPVILGEEGYVALLGVVTLEILGLVFNPFDRTLNPMRMLLG
ncbi:MAG TPA: aspartyl protease family protein [Sedimentisphaerales bacterium]|nr:aspartyl protease family protein [Sedimentisphaerales bacterium]